MTDKIRIMMRSKDVSEPGEYYMSDSSGGPSLYNVKIVDGEVMINPAHRKCWVEIDCMLDCARWEKKTDEPPKGILFYWGRMFTNDHTGAVRKVWIGPLTRSEMREEYEEFRHMTKEVPDTINQGES